MSSVWLAAELTYITHDHTCTRHAACMLLHVACSCMQFSTAHREFILNWCWTFQEKQYKSTLMQIMQPSVAKLVHLFKQLQKQLHGFCRLTYLMVILCTIVTEPKCHQCYGRKICRSSEQFKNWRNGDVIIFLRGCHPRIYPTSCFTCMTRRCFKKCVTMSGELRRARHRKQRTCHQNGHNQNITGKSYEPAENKATFFDSSVIFFPMLSA